MIFAITSQEYKHKVQNLHDKLLLINKNYQKEFVDLFFSHLHGNDRHKVKLQFVNFIHGRSYIQGISSPHFFWPKLQMYYDFSLKQTIGMEDLISELMNSLEKIAEEAMKSENPSDLNVDVKKGKVRIQVTIDE